MKIRKGWDEMGESNLHVKLKEKCKLERLEVYDNGHQ